MADSGIAAWDQKYRTAIDLWRPISAIRLALTDGNANTHPDTDWEPLSADEDDRHFSPCFPAWVSGHATFGGTWGRVMETEFDQVDHTDPFPVTLTTEDPHALRDFDDEREFDSFAEAAEENAISRIYLGVHYRVDAVDGLATGRLVANHVTNNELGWEKTCAGWTCATTIP